MDTKQTLLDAIAKTVAELEDYEATARASALRELALAYRHTVGGPQPGASVVTD